MGPRLPGEPSQKTDFCFVFTKLTGACALYSDDEHVSKLLHKTEYGANYAILSRVQGEEGVLAVLQLLKDELKLAMALAGNTRAHTHTHTGTKVDLRNNLHLCEQVVAPYRR